MDNLWSLLERNARNFPEMIAIRYPAERRTLTWLELRNLALELARQLEALGVVKGDRIASLFPNCPEAVITFYAAAYLGAVIVPVNNRLTVTEITFILENSEAKVLLFSADKRATAEEATKATGKVILLSGADFPTASIGPGPGTGYLPGGYAAASEAAEILYTSGTTGRPKGVVLTHYAVISVALMMAYEAEIRAGDNLLLLMPLTHSAPLNLFLVGAGWTGACVTLGEFTPQNIVELVSSERTTHFFGAPVAYQLLIRLPNLQQYDLSSMKYWIYGGAPTGREQVAAWQQALPGKFMSVYGLTEAGPNGLALRPDEHVSKAGSIGNRGSINAEIKVLREDGSETGYGEIGEIALKAPSLMTGYFKNPAATAEVIREGWLLTGDIARKDEDGYIWVMDRKKDMIISGGVNVYPKEIEDVLLTHPGILDAAVIGVPHPDWGETVCAVIVPKAEQEITLAEVSQYCRGKLADYKVPKLLKTVTVLPRNASGKILKFMLRNEAI